MGTLRRQSIESMRAVADQLAVARIDTEHVGDVTPEALVMSTMFEASQVSPSGRNTKNGARDAMRILAEDAARRADGVGELTMDQIFPPQPEEFRAFEGSV